MSISALMIREQQAERRREERWRVRFRGRWLDARQGEMHAQRARPVGTCIVVEMPDGVCKVCRIAWNSGNYHGAQFPEPLSVAELDSLLSPLLAI
jgi:hypothetical protein